MIFYFFIVFRPMSGEHNLFSLFDTLERNSGAKKKDTNFIKNGFKKKKERSRILLKKDPDGELEVTQYTMLQNLPIIILIGDAKRPPTVW